MLIPDEMWVMRNWREDITKAIDAELNCADVPDMEDCYFFYLPTP
jgi:hypothetical protein